jgi:hypothetical protein
MGFTLVKLHTLTAACRSMHHWVHTNIVMDWPSGLGTVGVVIGLEYNALALWIASCRLDWRTSWAKVNWPVGGLIAGGGAEFGMVLPAAWRTQSLQHPRKTTGDFPHWKQYIFFSMLVTSYVSCVWILRVQKYKILLLTFDMQMGRSGLSGCWKDWGLDCLDAVREGLDRCEDLCTVYFVHMCNG